MIKFFFNFTFFVNKDHEVRDTIKLHEDRTSQMRSMQSPDINAPNISLSSHPLITDVFHFRSKKNCHNVCTGKTARLADSFHKTSTLHRFREAIIPLFNSTL